MIALVGFTGFVGSNLIKKGNFDCLYNSKNIHEAYGTQPDLLVYAGVPAEKYIANNFPDKDEEVLFNSIKNIKLINPKKIVLISTVDVFKNPMNVDEDSIVDIHGLHTYGLNRYRLEQWVLENLDDYLIVRLPGLFGENLKKNFIFDYINIIPTKLTESKFLELSLTSNLIRENYIKCNNGFYKFVGSDEIKKKVKDEFLKLGFTAMNFTDSRNRYQFYNLEYLYNHIEIALKNKIKLLHLTTEPIVIRELYSFLSDKSFYNEFLDFPITYDVVTKYDSLFNGKNGYIFNKTESLNDIKSFIDKFLSKG